MFILTIIDADGMTYTEAFRDKKKAQGFVPPAWAKLKTPTTRRCVRFASVEQKQGEVIHV